MESIQFVRIWRITIIVFCAAHLLFACNRERDIVINGDLKSATTFLEGKKLYLGNAETRLFVDTVVVRNGQFAFKVNVEKGFVPYRASIVFETGNPAWPYQLVGYLNPYFKKTDESDFYAEPGIMQLSLDTIRKYGKEKNVVTFRIAELNPQTSVAFHHFAFRKDGGNSPDNRNYNRSLVEKHPTSMYLLRSLNAGKAAIKTDEAKHLLSLFAAEMRDNPTYIALKAYLEYENKTGTDFPTELVLKTANDQSVKESLVDASRHNLVVFWASWCGPCRMEIPQIKKLYESEGKNLNIVSISVDKDRNAWKKAMEKEQMPWKQFLLPLGKTYAVLDKKYNLQTIPIWVLLDGNGRVVDQHVGYEVGKNGVDLKVASLLR